MLKVNPVCEEMAKMQALVTSEKAINAYDRFQ
jgi:hypothetical protein